jgi:subtilisin family serine protease
VRRTRAVAVAFVTVCLLAAAAPARAVNDPAFDRQWGMQLIGAPAAWDRATGAGVTIAVVDTGVDLGHEDLAPQLVPGINVVSPGQPPQDDYGHGTHVAGIAAAAKDNGRGVAGTAPGAKIMPVKVFKLDATGQPKANSQDIDTGVRWAVDHGARVINMSFGDQLSFVLGPGFGDTINYAWQHGAVPVVAAGNNGNPANSPVLQSSGFSTEPALVVSAVTRQDTLASYSSDVGDAQWGIAAPGGAADNNPADDVFSTYWDQAHPDATNYYAYLAGTSMAAPHVAGAVAVMLSMGLTPDQAVHALLSTAKDLGPAGPDTTYGHGRLDLAKAVASVPRGTSGGGGSGGGSGGGTTRTTSRRSGGGSRSPAPTSAGTAAAPTTGGPGGQATGTTGPTTPTGNGGPARGPQALGHSHSGGGGGRPWGASLVALALLGGVGTETFRRARLQPR